MNIPTVEVDEVVTLDIGNPNASNTFIVDTIEADGTALLRHPLSEVCLKRVSISEINIVVPTLKDSYERCIDFANQHLGNLSADEKADLHSVSMYFVYYRKLTNRMKKTLSDVVGKVAAAQLTNDVSRAVALIIANEALLDPFNRMWYENFKELFENPKKVVSKKQQDSLFNMAGFILAETANPVTYKA